jgi:hypothetical protein
LGKARCIELQSVSGLPPKLFQHIIERDDGKYQIGTRCDAPGPSRRARSRKP